VLGRKAVATTDRRDMSPLGVARRKRFEDSLDLLRTLGLSPNDVEQYRRLARKIRKLPHQMVSVIAEEAAQDAALLLHPACYAVEDYLAAWFPGGVIERFEWTGQRGWVFKVTVPKLAFQLLVSTQFLDKANDHEIGMLLHEWNVASRMRMVGTKDWVCVTPNGVSLGVPEPV